MKAPNCKWCGKEATRMEYRDIDGMVSKSPSCEECFHTNTNTLIEMFYNKKKDKNSKL